MSSNYFLIYLFSPESYKELVKLEMEHNLLINLLFIEKSKYVRKVVETLFILMSQSKISENQNLSVNRFEFKFKDKVYKSVREILMVHIINNYKKIYDGQVYEEYFNLFGHMLVNEKGTYKTKL